MQKEILICSTADPQVRAAGNTSCKNRHQGPGATLKNFHHQTNNIFLQCESFFADAKEGKRNKQTKKMIHTKPEKIPHF